MSASLRTTYFGALGSIVEPADDDAVLGVVRYPQEFVEHLVDRNVQALAPPEHLLDAYKTVEDAADSDGHRNPSAVAWTSVSLEERYRAYLDRTGQQQVLDELRTRIRGGETVWLVCWEKDVRYCHRRLLADALASDLEVTVDHHPAPDEIEDDTEPQSASLDDFNGGGGR